MEWRGFSAIHREQDESNACDILTAKAQRRKEKEKAVLATKWHERHEFLKDKAILTTKHTKITKKRKEIPATLD